MTVASEQVEIDIGSQQSAVAWGAIIGGAVGAAALSLILLVLGSGLGLSMASPWTIGAAGAGAIAVGTVIWLIVVQWVASAFGGYLTGRLRSHSADPYDEVYFRDTANGFLAWALATLLVAGLLTSAVSSIIGAGAQLAGGAVSSVASAGAQAAPTIANAVSDQTAYYVDTLFRPGTGGANAGGAATAPQATGASSATSTTDTATAATTAGSTSSAPANDAASSMATTAPADTSTAAAPVANAPAAPPQATATTAAGDDTRIREETTRILANGLAAKEFPSADRDYLAAEVAQATGVPPDEAKQRVDGVIQSLQTAKSDAQAAADQARKDAAKLALYMFASLIIGAFIAAAAAALGGHHRDDMRRPVVVR